MNKYSFFFKKFLIWRGREIFSDRVVWLVLLGKSRGRVGNLDFVGGIYGRFFGGNDM